MTVNNDVIFSSKESINVNFLLKPSANQTKENNKQGFLFTNLFLKIVLHFVQFTT